MDFLNSLDVLIGLIVIYLILSLGVTVCNEWLDTLFDTRSTYLKSSIHTLLGSPKQADAFYNHPLIKGLCRGRNRYPTYVSPATFRDVLYALLDPSTVATSLNAWLNAIQKLPDGSLKTTLLSLSNQVSSGVNNSDTQLQSFEQKIDSWFAENMERTTDWYKRRVQLWTFLIALVLTVFLNVDTLVISRYLFNNSDAREVYVQAADRIVKQTSPDSLKKILATPSSKTSAQAQQQLDMLIRGVRTQLTQNTTIPIGWQSVVEPTGNEWLLFVLSKLVGLFLTVAAISAGAPFWFDTLKNVMTIRNAVRKFTVDQQNGS